jgi:hypothetical protein
VRIRRAALTGVFSLWPWPVAGLPAPTTQAPWPTLREVVARLNAPVEGLQNGPMMRYRVTCAPMKSEARACVDEP